MKLLDACRGVLGLAGVCGMKYLPRERAFGKLRALAEGAAIVRKEIGG